jgi:hypothetical protein
MANRVLRGQERFVFLDSPRPFERVPKTVDGEIGPHEEAVETEAEWSELFAAVASSDSGGTSERIVDGIPPPWRRAELVRLP